MPAVAFAIAIASSVLGASLRLQAGVRTEGRSRTLDGPGVARLTTAEVGLAPRAALELAAPDLVLRAAYTPALRAPDVLTSTEPDVIHEGEVRARLHVLPAWWVTAVAGGERGTTDLLAESRRRAVVPEAVPSTESLRYVAARADLTLAGTFDLRTTGSLTAGWFAGGGDDPASLVILPYQRGVRGGARLDWNATRRDVVGIDVAALGARLTGEREAALASATAGWRRQLTRTVEGRLRAGALASFDDAPGRSGDRELRPTGEAGVVHASERLHTSEEAYLRLGATLDRIRGTVDRSLELVISSRWAATRAISLGGHARAVLVSQETGESRRGSVELRADWRLSPHTSVGMGGYGQWQRTPDPVLPSFVESGAFVSFSVELPRAVRDEPDPADPAGVQERDAAAAAVRATGGRGRVP